MRIQFVCAGNICRSVIAERLFRVRNARLIEPVAGISSSGLIADPDDAIPNPLTVLAARAVGVDVADHRARRFDPKVLEVGELVLVMELGQQAEVRARTSLAQDRVLLLGSFAAGFEAEIADPGGGPFAGYEACVEHIRAGVEGLVAWLEGAPD